MVKGTGRVWLLRSRECPEAEIEIVPQSHDTFTAGLARYKARPDKGYSLTDCISMNVMTERDIREILTNDDHFTQEGFKMLL
jgi:predicted nucleic acid-binding protein